MYTIDSIRLSEKQKQQLSNLKRKTGIKNWNVLCRWALCLSLSEPSIPPKEDITADSNVEMTWKVFAGEQADVYLAILHQSYQNQRDQIDDMHFNEFFKLHLNRGISYLNLNHQKYFLPKSSLR